VERLTAEAVHARQTRLGRDGEQADGREEETGNVRTPVVSVNNPLVAGIVEFCGCDNAAKFDIASQIELVSDVVKIGQCLRLRGEQLTPVPLLEQLFRERVAVAITLGIEAASRIPVLVPGAADVVVRLKNANPNAQFSEPEQLIKAADACADDDEVVLRDAVRHSVDQS
jgi:hypothetical protein